MEHKEFLSQIDHDRIVEAIRDAEKETSGEIRVHVQPRTGSDIRALAWGDHYGGPAQRGLYILTGGTLLLIAEAYRRDHNALLREQALRAQAETEHQRLLAQELNHRIKNLLVTVQAIASQTLKMKEVPVIQLGHLTEAQAKALRLADNQLALNSSWNAELLSIELRDLKLANYDLQLLGFEQHTLDWFTGSGSMVDANGEWVGMPEFTQEDKTAFRTVKIHFTCQEDVDAFARLLSQKITDGTKFLWFPPIEAESRMTTTYSQQAAE